MADHVCPVWVGRLMANPLRKLLQNPDKILSAHVDEGMTVLDVGCAMGFFSLPMAKKVGQGGRVVCVDLQPEMLSRLEERARKADLAERIEARRCPADSLGISDLAGKVDFALAFAMVHETPDPAKLLSEISACLAPGGKLLVAEPRGHVDEGAFEQTLTLATEAGLELVDRPAVRMSHAALFSRPADAKATKLRRAS